MTTRGSSASAYHSPRILFSIFQRAKYPRPQQKERGTPEACQEISPGLSAQRATPGWLAALAHPRGYLPRTPPACGDLPHQPGTELAAPWTVRRDHATERRRSHESVWKIEVRAIEQIERFQANLQPRFT